MRDMQKSEEKLIVSLNRYIDSTIKGLSYTESDFAKSLKKWKPLLVSTVLKLNNITKEPYEDICQELLTSLSRVYKMQGMELYRYNKRIYLIAEESKEQYRLVSIPGNKREQDFWADKDQVELVKKGKLSSLIYKKMQQKAASMIRRNFLQKNGYCKEKLSEKKSVKLNTANVWSDQRWKKVEYGFVQIVTEVLYEFNSIPFYRDNNQEEFIIIDMFLDHLKKVNKDFLSELVEFSCSSNACEDFTLKKHFKLSWDKLFCYRRELLTEFNKFSGEYVPISSKVKPIYLPASVIR